MQKHYFLFQVHKDPKLFKRIIDGLKGENHFFLVNIDKKSPYTDQFEIILRETPNVVCKSHFNIEHAAFSQVACTLYQLREIVNNHPDFDYIHTLSGQDYPCVNAKDFDKFFENSNNKSYMQCDSDDEVIKYRQQKYRDRIQRWNFSDVFHNRASQKLHLAGIARRIWRFPRNDSLLTTMWGGGGTGFHFIDKPLFT